MLPGVTGLAQISGRNQLRWSERLALDVYYVENWSLLLDFKILLKTIFKVLSRDSVAVVPNVLMQDLHDERQSIKPTKGFTG
jgi:lipopolysaccharide/colanic/teichoic acid biosynthesis glycosyltransferase